MNYTINNTDWTHIELDSTKAYTLINADKKAFLINFNAVESDSIKAINGQITLKNAEQVFVKAPEGSFEITLSENAFFRVSDENGEALTPNAEIEALRTELGELKDATAKIKIMGVDEIISEDTLPENTIALVLI